MWHVVAACIYCNVLHSRRSYIGFLTFVAPQGNFWNLNAVQGTKNTLGDVLFYFTKSKQTICLLDGLLERKNKSVLTNDFLSLLFNNEKYFTVTLMYLENRVWKYIRYNLTLNLYTVTGKLNIVTVR